MPTPQRTSISALSFFLFFALGSPAVHAQTPADTLQNYEMEEAVVTASPKETTSFRRQPVSVRLFSDADLQRLGAHDVKGLAAHAPNFFLPSYGSRITSAVYIRGIGSRQGTPAVGLYVDNVPYLDKSAYDFSFLDVDRVDILRGPQGTLYGCNTMGGLVRIFTADPRSHRGTDVSLQAAGRGGKYAARGVTYIHPSEELALSAGAFYEGQRGFFTNSATGEKADRSLAGGGKMRLAWTPTSALRLDLTASFEHSNERACPYYLVGTQEGEEADAGLISQNLQSRYRRDLLNVGLGVSWRAAHFTLSSITALQHLNDRLFMDQDFTRANIFSLEQRQRLSTLTEELSAKGRVGTAWRWTTGAFLMYQAMKTSCPVTFYDEGVDMLNSTFASVLPQRPAMSLAFTTETLPLTSQFSTPKTSAAVFHQSTVELGAGLSVIAGIRLAYDHTHMRLATGSAAPLAYRFSLPAFGVDANLEADPSIRGFVEDDTWQLLPKFALQYNHRSGRGNVYVAVSKGYRSGGYNLQSYSSLAQAQLQRSMMMGVREYSLRTIEAMPLPDAAKAAATSALTGALDAQTPAEQEAGALAYSPEQSWNYELGGHLSFLSSTLHVNYTLFYMTTKDQQLVHFAANGLGREVVNAGRSRSLGAELSVEATAFKQRLSLSASYGLTDARFTSYSVQDDEGATVSYKGKRVPFAPRHTLGAAAEWRQPLNGTIEAFNVGLAVQGAGRIYWDEGNTWSEPFYATLSAHVGLTLRRNVSLTLFARNLTAADNAVFAFQTMGRTFQQVYTPRHFGAEVRVHF